MWLHEDFARQLGCRDLSDQLPTVALPLVCSPTRKDAPHEHGFSRTVVVEDHPPVADAQTEVLAACQPSHVERAIPGEEAIEAADDASANWRIKAPQILLGAACEAQRSAAAHPA